MPHQTDQTDQAVFVEHDADRAIVWFVAPVSESSIIGLVRTVNELRKKRFYPKVELRIASPGGEVLALQYFLEALSDWRDDGLALTTLALTSCSSAAAVMLSLGDRRKASPTSDLLYHFARIRVDENVPMTRNRAQFFAQSLQQTDMRILHELVNRAVCNMPELDDLSIEDRTTLTEIRVALGELSDATDHAAWLQGWMTATKDASKDDRQARWETLYSLLCQADRHVSGRLAHALGLLDELVQPMTRNPTHQPTPARYVEIPEWKQAYTDGMVAVNHLKRHTLVLGETGSGKTASAILPALAAAYNSPEVGVALVIDPKFELRTELERLSTIATHAPEHRKRLEWIKTDECMIDLMSTEDWSIRDLIEQQRYWTAAERVLQRVAGLSQSNPARLLLGQPPPGVDPVWDREGLRLATAVIALAIEWCVDWKTIAKLINDKLGATPLLTPEYEAWKNVAEAFVKIFPGSISLKPKWEKWFKDVREAYIRVFAHPYSRKTDGSWDKNALRYATHREGFINGIDARSSFEERMLRRMERLPETESERKMASAMGTEYRTRIREERDAWKKEWENDRKIALDSISEEYVLPMVGGFIYDILLQGVGGRTEAEWQLHLADELSAKMRELDDRRKTLEEILHSEEKSGSWEDDALQEFYVMEDIEGNDWAMETALADLVAEELRRGGEDEWKEFVDRAKHQIVESTLPDVIDVKTTTFLRMLDGFETRMKALDDFIDWIEPVESPSLLAIGDGILQTLFSAAGFGAEITDRQGNLTDQRAPTGVQCLSGEMSGRGGESDMVSQVVAAFADMRNFAKSTFSGCHSSASSIMFEFARPEIARVLYFGCEPSVVAARRRRDEFAEAGPVEHKKLVDFREAVSNRHPSPGVIYIYQPSRHKYDQLIATTCKALFFESILDSAERRTDGGGMPLTGYIADEFQRFVTADPVHGEQSFLDVCRSFGAFAVLACQSIASLRYALCETEPDRDKRNSAIDIICNNTATKLFFRTTDQETATRVRGVSPILSDGLSLIDSRPLSTLRLGECYASFPDGRFERLQMDEYGRIRP